MRFIGVAKGSTATCERMDWAEPETADNERITLLVAFNYGGARRSWMLLAHSTAGTRRSFAAVSTPPRCTTPTC